MFQTEHRYQSIPSAFGKRINEAPAPQTSRLVACCGLTLLAFTAMVFTSTANSVTPNIDASLLSVDTMDSFDNMMQWYNAPTDWHSANGTIMFTVPSHTDYWRITYHGFIKDNGPFYYRPVIGNFEVVARFSGAYASLFDQAGIMVRESSEVWMKCGVEFTNGVQHASTVITREYSDWSILPIESNPASIWFKAKRTNECIETYYSLDGEAFTQIRQGYLSTASTLDVGIVAAAPIGDGFDVVFDEFYISQ